MASSKYPGLRSFRTHNQDIAVEANGQVEGEVVIVSQPTRGIGPGLNQRITEVKPW